ncbi:hypothetical protein ADIS_3941 [Lunatimonas lonarensis]|uniref:Uncharacterized protein n=1 Tax=Lunatimonas lonarensis TaxID=1232681 RepID=R7ZN88_9BACT|nr:hypothetical protein ADIS_3941 [Lunatimonas lonarensis]
MTLALEAGVVKFRSYLVYLPDGLQLAISELLKQTADSPGPLDTTSRVGRSEGAVFESK